MAEFASKGVAGAGLGTGIAGLSLGVLNSGLFNGLLGGGWNNGGYGGCGGNYLVNRYEAGQSARIAELETEVKLRDANIYISSHTLKILPIPGTLICGSRKTAVSNMDLPEVLFTLSLPGAVMPTMEQV